MLHATELPEPSPDAVVVSAELSERIRVAIGDAGGHIGFDDYMRMALYEPGLGYYLAGAVKFGGQGDFVTAPELSPLFGRCVARQCRQILARTGGDVVEFGAGSGLLAASVLTELGECGPLPGRYSIIELSPELRERQRESIRQHAGAHLERVEWNSHPPERPLNGVIIANEILDALPVKVFKIAGGCVYERRVRAAKTGFGWLDVPAGPTLEQTIHHLVPNEIVESNVHYVSEINVGVEPWTADLARMMDHAVAIVIDYGFPRSEYYHPGRASGTLMCHFRHRKHDDPFWFPGIQDITASVDFTGVAEAADRNGLQVLGFAEQASFLFGCGLLEDAEGSISTLDESARQRVAYETKVLTLPTEMGTRFKVMALGKRYNEALRGFQLRDDRHRL